MYDVLYMMYADTHSELISKKLSVYVAQLITILICEFELVKCRCLAFTHVRTSMLKNLVIRFLSRVKILRM